MGRGRTMWVKEGCARECGWLREAMWKGSGSMHFLGMDGDVDGDGKRRRSRKSRYMLVYSLPRSEDDLGPGDKV